MRFGCIFVQVVLMLYGASSVAASASDEHDDFYHPSRAVIGVDDNDNLVFNTSGTMFFGTLDIIAHLSNLTKALSESQNRVATLEHELEMMQSSTNPFEELNYIDTIVGSGSFDANNNASNWDGSIQPAHLVNVRFSSVHLIGDAGHGHAGCLLLSGGTEFHRIAKYCYDDKLLRPVAGDGVAGFSGDNGPAINARVDTPLQITTHPVTNDIYFCDRGNHRVRKIDFETNVISTFAGNGNDEYSGDDASALSAGIGQPLSLTFDKDGSTLFVSQRRSDVIRRIDMNTNTITTFAGTGSRGYSGDGGLATNAQLDGDSGLHFDSSFIKMYLADSHNQRVRVIDMETMIISTFAGTGQEGSSGDGGDAKNARLDLPAAVTFDKENDKMFITEVGGHRIRVVDMKSNIITTLAGTGEDGFNGDLRPSKDAQLHDPIGPEMDSHGNLIFCDRRNNRVRRIWV